MENMLPGKLTITRTRRRGSEDEIINIVLQDEGSGAHVIEIDMDLADFARALTNLGYQSCAFGSWASSTWG